MTNTNSSQEPALSKKLPKKTKKAKSQDDQDIVTPKKFKKFGKKKLSMPFGRPIKDDKTEAVKVTDKDDEDKEEKTIEKPSETDETFMRKLRRHKK
jgi:hypothetical protein